MPPQVPDIEAGADARGARNLDSPADAHEKVEHVIKRIEREASKAEAKRPAPQAIDQHSVRARGAEREQPAPRRAAFMVLERAAKVGLHVLHASILQSVLHCRRRAA